MRLKKVFTIAMLAMSSTASWAVNPYLPLWKYIPDGDLRVRFFGRRCIDMRFVQLLIPTKI